VNMRACSHCGNPDAEFYIIKSGPRAGKPARGRCNTCYLDSIKTNYKPRCPAKKRAYQEANREQIQERNKPYRRRVRRERRERVIAHYGGACACCGETRYEFLAIDHMEGGGHQHRKSLGNNAALKLLYLLDTEKPTGYRILCHNCNISLGLHGYCPHDGCRTLPEYEHLQGRERVLVQQKAYRLRIRLEALKEYGGACACCGETRHEFLAIDHIEGGGVQHRKALGSQGKRFHHYLKTQGYPPGYRVLCHNCNTSFGQNGCCPHTLTPQTSVG
jgi:hypothetical protein